MSRMNDIGTFNAVSFTPTDVQELLDSVCNIGKVSSVTPIQDGVNVCAMISAETGEYFVKFQSFNRSAVDRFTSQIFLLQYFIENDFSFNTATPVAYDFSRTTFPYRWYMTEFIKGNSISPESITLTQDLAEDLGKTLATINSIHTPVCGDKTVKNSNQELTCRIDSGLPFEEGKPWNELFTQKFQTCLSRSDSRFIDISELLRSRITSVDLPTDISPQLLHFDFWWENLRVSDQEDLYVMDWERTFSGDPLANRYLSEYFLFDSPAIEAGTDGRYKTDRDSLRDCFRESYNTHYTGSECLQKDLRVGTLYELYPYTRELQGFPYWWRNETEDRKEERAKILRTAVRKISDRISDLN